MSDQESSDDVPPSLYLAVFGDIHGRVALMYTLAHLWTQRTGHRLHALLQVGDMGAFPDHGKLDKATRAHAKRDPDELDFVTFSAPTVQGAHYLDRDDAPDTYFIRGNHEDFGYLAQFSGCSAVDPWGRLRYIEDGAFAALPCGDMASLLPASLREELALPVASFDALYVGGFGGVTPPSAWSRGRGKQARAKHRKALKRAMADSGKYFDDGTIETALSHAPPLDILMTHEGPACDVFPQGSQRLTTLARRLSPSWHFFGHHHAVVGPAEGPGGGFLVGLEHLDFDQAGQLQDDAWGILRWPLDGSQASFCFANSETMPWLQEVRRYSYRSFL